MLQQKREELKLSLGFVATSTRISSAYLRALEENEFHLLPGEAYVRGFIRSYARLISLDPVEVLAAREEQMKSLLAPDENRARPPLGERTRRFCLHLWAAFWGAGPDLSLSRPGCRKG